MPRQAINKTTNTELKEQSNAIFTQSTPLTETVKMISRGLIPDIPEEIVLKAIQRKDKKKVLMSETDNILLSLLQTSIVSPQNFNVYNLLPFESEYLLYRLRVLTYGADHTFKDTCPYCGHTNDVEINLNDIPIKDIPDNFNIIFDIPPLPVSGAQLTCRLLNEGELATIRKQAVELKDGTNNKNVDIDIIWESRIVAINGDTSLAPIEITTFLDELSDYDSEYFMEYYTKYEGNYGLQTKLNYTCDSCSNKVSADMPNIRTFFRPTFKIPDFS